MMYLIEPDSTVRMTSLSLGEIRVTQTRDGQDPAELKWTKAPEDIPAGSVLAAALRHGIDIRRGLMVHSGFVDQLLEPDRLRRVAAAQRQVEDQLASIRPIPGQDDGEHQDLVNRARRDAENALRSAKHGEQQVLDETVREDLAAAWERMNGTLDTGSHATHT